MDIDMTLSSLSVAACPPGCDCQADFSCNVLSGVIQCNDGYVTTGATCVGKID